jgi:tetratricopeptide (TPR) repeat protein
MGSRLNVTRLGWSRLRLLAPFFLLNFAFAQSQSPSSSPPDLDPPTTSSGASGNPIANSVQGGNCFLAPLNGLEIAPAGTADMQVPVRTLHEFEEACAALRSKRMADAEGHLRKAVKQDPKFSEAWVLLGQIFEAQQKMEEAHEACSKPTGSYLPAYLCLADISARAKNWDDVLRLSSLALEIDPATAASAYAYNAAANFNLHNLPAAERSALRALEIDTTNSDPRVHFLLAQIYEAKGDRAGQAGQLREYLKFVTDPADEELVKKVLANLQ